METHGNFKTRFVEALRKRLAPNTGLHADQLAGAIGRHGESVRNWLRGDCGISSEAVDAVIAFFMWQGDHAFIVEVYPQVTPLVQRKREADEALALVHGLRTLIQQTGAAA